MFDHVTIGAADREASRRFYAVVLGALGREPTTGDPALGRWGDFSIAQAGDDRPVTSGLHIGFAAPTFEHIEAFWRAGVDAGYRDDGAPGPRPEYGESYLGGFLLDPDGNSAEAVWHDDLRPEGIDHLWIRVDDRAACRRFYATLGEDAGFHEAADRPDRTRYARGPHQGDFSIVDGPPTTPFHLAFSVEAGRERPPVLDPAGHTVECVHRPG